MPLLTKKSTLRVKIISTASPSPKHLGGSLSTELKTELEGIELSAARDYSPSGHSANYGCCCKPPSPPNREQCTRGGNGISFLPPCLLLTPTCPLPSDLLDQLPYYLNLIASTFVLLFPLFN